MQVSPDQQLATATMPMTGDTASTQASLLDCADIAHLVSKRLSRRDAWNAGIATNRTEHEGWGPNNRVSLNEVLRLIRECESDHNDSGVRKLRSIHTIDVGLASDQTSGNRGSKRKLDRNNSTVFGSRLAPSDKTSPLFHPTHVHPRISLDEIIKACPLLRQITGVTIHDQHSTEESKWSTCTIRLQRKGSQAIYELDRTPVGAYRRSIYGPQEPTVYLPVELGTFELTPSYRYVSDQCEEHRRWTDHTTLAEEHESNPPRCHILSASGEHCSEFVDKVLARKLASQAEAHESLPRVVALPHQFDLRVLETCIDLNTSAQKDPDDTKTTLDCSGARLIGDLFSPEADSFWKTATRIPHMTLPGSSLVASEEDASNRDSVKLRPLPTYSGHSLFIDFEVADTAFEDPPSRLPAPHELLQSVSGNEARPARRCRLKLKEGSTQRSEALCRRYNDALMRGYMYLDRRYEGDQTSVEEDEWYMDNREHGSESSARQPRSAWRNLARWVRPSKGSG